MTNEDKPAPNKTKNPKKKKLLIVWLISVLIFIISVVWLMVEVNADQNGATISLVTLVLLGSMVVGGLSFLWWLLLSVNKVIKSILISLIVLVCVIFSIPIFIARYAIVTGQKMEPAYKNDEYYLVSIISYKLQSPKRGDVVEYKLNGGGSVMGRIIGLPNENLMLKKGEVIINGNILNEPYVDWTDWDSNNISEIKLEENKYLILFDRRGTGINQIDRNDIVGKFTFKLR